MKKILIFISLVLISCYRTNISTEKTNFVLKEFRNPLELLTIDSCQYIYGFWGNATVLTHKGNCNNKIHFR